nr:14874_t:CDS:2 [Entrophospora candida]
MNGAMKYTPERTWTAHVLAYLFFITFCFIDSLHYFSCERSISTKIDVQENNFKADDKINEDRQKLINEGVFAINKFMTRTRLPTWEVCSTLKVFLAQGFGDNVEIGQMIFIGPGLYLFSPFTIPALVIPTSTDNLEHVP